MRLDTIIKDYLQALRVEQGAALTTHRGYQSHLHHFHAWLTTNGYAEPTLAEFTVPVLRRFLYYLSGKNLRPRTIRSYFQPLKGIGEFLISNGLATENAAKGVNLPKKDAAIRKTVSDAEIRLLLDACTRERNARKSALNSAVLHVLVYGAIRRSELCDLRVDDIDVKAKSLLVRCGKGSKSRKIYLPDVAITALKEWLALRPKGCRHDFLFTFDVRRRLWHTSLHTLFEDLKAVAGLAGHDNVQPHSIRHWRATDLLRSGANIRDVQAFLGHSSLQVTAIYCHSDEEQLRNISELTVLRNLTPTQPPDPRPDRQDTRPRSRRIAR